MSDRSTARPAPHACRPGCGACCIAPSISSPIPGMPMKDGISKPAGVRCIQLTTDDRCAIFGHPDRPAVCSSLKPDPDMCGDSREQAMRWLGYVETATAP
ncbi:YkgJ family cysteine cluster protein [Piscinibacter gummiphilus]|uniref:Proteinase inhibitor n=1 Tax=Piscinibacter gummiphilus TaxID=946333 RepID=A0A1W6LHB9_9BURK|nr:YkgJ family cysteine cluster protein [Piscinibacter gummiphilus]ARN23616.1 proteinase inhibitor [Piscinibacter gummiphilus]ATU68324.1 YkgJ family cysteine cluster protein [Piscinibacter gummiphilus]